MKCLVAIYPKSRFANLMEIMFQILKKVYLQQFLFDEAAVILGQLDPRKDSYEDTWARVKETFENKSELPKMICEMFKFFNQTAIKEKSSVAVKQFYNATKECILSFKSFGIM